MRFVVWRPGVPWIQSVVLRQRKRMLHKRHALALNRVRDDQLRLIGVAFETFEDLFEAVKVMAITPLNMPAKCAVFRDQVAKVTVETPGAKVTYDGDARIDGVPGTAAPVLENFPDAAGANCGALLPTGKAVDTIDAIEVT